MLRLTDLENQLNSACRRDLGRLTCLQGSARSAACVARLSQNSKRSRSPGVSAVWDFWGGGREGREGESLTES